jgi:signal transduction histidine kinase
LSEVDIPLRPAVSIADGDLGPWPLASVLRDQRAAEVDLGALSDRLSGRFWDDEPVRQALALPIPAPTHDRLAGLLVAGVSSRRILDDAYRTFFDLVAGHIGAAIADARAYQDISDRKRAEEERARLLESAQEARRRAEDANRLKDEFLATVSHELRAPLNSINGWAQLLRAGGLNDEEVARGLETIERSARSQNQTINDLLDVSRIIIGKMRCRPCPARLDHQ